MKTEGERERERDRCEKVESINLKAERRGHKGD